MKKILILSLPGLGNSLLLTPILKSIKENEKDCKITVLVMYKSCQEIFEGNPYIDEVILFEFMKQGYFNSLNFMNKLRKRKFDISILPHPSNRLQYNVINFLSGAKIKISHSYPYFNLRSFNFLNNKTLPLNYKHEIDENLDLLKFIFPVNTNVVDKRLILYLSKEDESYASAFFKSHKLRGLVIGIHAGSSNYSGMQHKRWPKEKFSELCNYLIKNYGANILIFGGNDEIELKKEIYNSIESKDKAIIIEANKIKKSAALIKKCNYFISNDSGLMHIASAVNTPTIAVTGIVDYKRTHPLNKNSAIISSTISCYPCYKFGETLHCKRKEKDYACLKYISIYNVISTLEKLKNNEDMGPILERVQDK